MKTGTKVLKWLVVVLLVLILVVSILVSVFGNRALRVGIENGASIALKVGVRVNDVSLKMLGGKLNLNGLEVDNPEGYQHEQLLTLGNVFVAVNIKSLMSDTVEIDQIRLDNVNLTIEQKGLTNNLQDILNNLPQSDAPGDKAGKQLKIKELQINGVTVNAKLLPIPGRADTVTLKVAPITLTNLGGDEKLDVAQLTATILKAITKGVTEQGKDLLPTDMLKDMGSSIFGAGQETLKQATEAGKGIIEGGKGAIEGAGDAIKGLFQKKE